MPKKRKDSPFWWASFTDPMGKRVRRSTGTTQRKEAEALEAKWKLEAFKERVWGEKPTVVFEQLMTQYLKATQSEKRSSGTDVVRTRTLKDHFFGLEMTELLPVHIRSYVDSRKQAGVKNSTINRELSLLSGAINYANREWDWGLPNPIPGRRQRESDGRLRWLRREEAAALIAGAESAPKATYLADFIILALHTGCRKGELLGLEWERVDLREDLIWLGSKRTKNGKRRSVPLNAEARHALIRRFSHRSATCPDSPWVFVHADGSRIQDVKKSFAGACKRAGIEDFRIHDLRHTCAAWMVTARVPLSEVRDLLGHSSVTVTERYAHLAPENVRAAVDKLLNVARSGHAESNVTQINHSGGK
jgi:integrase